MYHNSTDQYRSVGRRKTIHVRWRQAEDRTQAITGALSTTSRLLTALITEKLHVLYVIGMQNTSILRHSDMAAENYLKINCS